MSWCELPFNPRNENDVVGRFPYNETVMHVGEEISKSV